MYNNLNPSGKIFSRDLSIQQILESIEITEMIIIGNLSFYQKLILKFV